MRDTRTILTTSLIFWVLVLANSAVAQQNVDNVDSDVLVESYSPTLGIFFEFGGSGLTIASINVDFQFPLSTGESYSKLGLRLGYGWQLYNLTMAPALLIGSIGNEHRLECGAGIVVKPYPHSEGLKLSPTTVKLGALVGWRFEEKNGGWLFRATFTPLYDTGNKRFFPFVGVSCGASIPF